MKTRTSRTLLLVCASLSGTLGSAALAQDAPFDSGNLPDEPITQSEIESGRLSLLQLQLEGLRMFTTSFNRHDGYGDGPINPDDTRTPGGRPTMQGNGMFLRVNGLDAQNCLECHAIVSAATVPATLGIGGVGGSNANAIILTTNVDSGDQDRDGEAAMDGRFANPPFLFGAGGVELLAKEMTRDLQALLAQAIANPGTEVALVTKGVEFGTITADEQGEIDTSNVEGVKDDLVVRPFGRKGEFPTTRSFDIEALQFHMGMQATELVGEGVDADGDGILNEITVGQLSALQVFATSMERPVARRPRGDAALGFELFKSVGCAECHIPALETESRFLPLAFPQVDHDPDQNVYRRINLNARPARFSRNRQGGLTVPLFADLKRHDMGPGLAESFSRVSDEENRMFTTARLWGIADTAPYLHDGRATTLADAILMHGGEAEEVRDAFDALSRTEKGRLIAFLRTLRTPKNPAARLARLARRKF